ncbi:uroporphyrinogen-III C-methyltransferase [Methylohalobius crimeensis]|uniref:uroporphyrinogen-III C-methyltransferase n=1 Tax=Methylohalobius crimeensis TaxID=244365 RepID=UPI0003B6352A|nr:uroporphyrinogen-III C-methyltransferase [Methylohalobius crimeensis]
MADLHHEDEFEDEGLSRLGIWIAVVLLILLASLGGAGYYVFQMLRTEQKGLGGEVGKETERVLNLTQQITALQKEVATLHSQVTQLEGKESTQRQRWQNMLDDQAEAFDKNLAALEKQLEMSHAKLQSHIGALQRQIGQTRSDVMIADAEYLLNVASQKLRLVGDVESALKAMQAADELLRLADDPALYRVREALAREIGALKKVQTPDVVGVSAQIMALEDRISALSLRLPHMGKVAPKQEGDGEEGGLLEKWQEVLTIRRRETDQSVEAILTPEEVEAIRHALILKLETARLAAVRGESELFRSSLEGAKRWVQEHFDPETESVQEFMTDLEELKARPVAVKVPEVGRALQLLRRLPQLRLEMDRLTPSEAASDKSAGNGSKPPREESPQPEQAPRSQPPKPAQP